MSLSTNLIRRGATYYFRARVPVDILHRFRHNELKRSLRTNDPRIARQRAAMARLRADSLFEAIRGNPLLTDDDIAELARQFYDMELRLDAAARAGADMMGGAMEDDLDWAMEERAKAIKELKEDLSRGRIAAVEPEAAYLIDELELDVEVDSIPYRRLCTALMRARLEATIRASERDQGIHYGEPKDPMFREGPKPKAEVPPSAPVVPDHLLAALQSLGAKPKAKKGGARFSEAIVPFLAEKARGLAEKSINDYRKTFAAFAQVVGDKPVGSIERDDVVAFKDVLLQCPADYRIKLKTEDIKEAVRLNATRQVPLNVLNAKTINMKYLSNLKSFFEWACVNQYHAGNPASGVSVKTKDKRKASEERDPFSVADLNAMFRQPLYTGCASGSRIYEPGEHRVGDHRFWAPLIGLFTGCRLNEIGQLRASDVGEHHGRLHFHVTDAGDDQRVKTTAGERKVPVHPALIEIGFADYLAAVRREGHDRLFPGWKKGNDGYYSSVLSKWFTRFLRKAKIKGDTTSFHSLRHTFRDALDNTLLSVKAINKVMGHEGNTMGERYGAKYLRPDDIERFCTLRYNGLDISSLRWAGPVVGDAVDADEVDAACEA